MTRALCLAVSVAASLGLQPATNGGVPSLRVTTPTPDTIVSGTTHIEVAISPEAVIPEVQKVSFFVDGRLSCTVERPPFRCTWDAGDVLRGRHIRVVATLAGDRRLVGNVHTKEMGYAERVSADAVLVPVIVRERGQFVRGLKQRDFELFEDNVAQSIASIAAEDAPLDLILAIDISGSMEQALPEVKVAVKRLLSRLRPGDAATLIGFNDTFFVVSERETDPQAREVAVDLLSSWGGTALYDATMRALDLVSRDWGRKGVVIFSDGEDRDSIVQREAAMARVQSSGAVLYMIGFGSGATVPTLRSSLESYSRTTGGRAFFPGEVKDLDSAFDAIVDELANQYVLSYSPLNPAHDGAWRSIKVHVRKGKYNITARPGYRMSGPQRARR